MTVIAGVECKGHVVIGADSACSDIWTELPLKGTKLASITAYHPIDNQIAGGCGSVRGLQILQHGFETPARKQSQDLEEWLATEYMAALRSTYKKAGVLTVKEGVVEGHDFLLGIGGRLFEVMSDFGFTQSRNGYLATGIGWQVALGALTALYKPAMTVQMGRRTVLQALAASCQHNHYCNWPLRLIWLDSEGKITTSEEFTDSSQF